MTKVKKVILSVVLLLLATVLCFSVGSKISKAETVPQDNSVCSNEEAVPYGIYTKLDFSLDGGNEQVWFMAKNQFTLFPSTVTVNLELYRSDTYQEDFSNMTLVATNYIYDLDQGETIKAIASTNGKQSYWKARAHYKIDNGDWKDNISATILFGADGIIIF